LQSRRVWPELTLARTPVGIALCLVVALMAQRSLDHYTGRSTPWVSLAAFGLAGLAFVILTRHIAAEASVDEAETPRPAAISLAVITVTLAISVLGCLDFGNNRFRPAGVLLWGGGLLLALLYLWLISAGPQVGGLLRTWSETKKVWVPAYGVVLLAIVLLGAWFRLHLNGEIPAEMGFDLASKYFDSLAIARGEYSIFFPARLGREGLFFYSVALLGRLAGITEATLHLTSAVFGTLTIIAVYFLARELYGRMAGLLAAFLLAVNRWHIVLSRTGFRAATMPLCTALALDALIRALRTRRPLDFGWAGVAVGMGVYSYRSFLFMPVAMGLGLLLYLLTHGLRQFRLFLPGLMAMALIAAAVIAPLARYVLENPDKYLTRERYQLQAMQAQSAQSPGTLAYYVRSLLAFNYRGDADSRFNVPYARQMGLASGVLLVLGLAYTLWHWRCGHNALLLAALFVLILPAALSMLPNEMPSSLRMSGAIVPAVVLAAVPVVVAQQAAASHRPTDPAENAGRSSGGETFGSKQTALGGQSRGDTVGVSLTVRTQQRQRTWTWQGSRASAVQCILAVSVVLLLAFETSEARQYYFHDYVAHLPEMSNYSVPRAIAREITQYGDLRSVYIKAWPDWFDTSVLQLHVGTDQSWNPFADALAPDQPPLSTLKQTALFIINGHDEASLAALHAFFSRGFAQAHFYPNGDLAFYTFLGEP
jgi:4-amino-4-deoxy-L-arabinose transferase-like glycosyltransferase